MPHPAPTNMIPLRKFALCIILIAGLLYSNNTAHAQKSIIRAILFYSSSCSHCHQVITQDLPPLVEKYQEQLYILAVNTSTPDGHVLFQAAIDYYHIPVERQGVPMLIVGDVVLVGSFEIPDQFPRIITDGLTQGGINWPDIPQLLAFLEEQNLIITEVPNDSEEINSDVEIVVQKKDSTSDNLENALENIENMTVSEKFAQDKMGNSISVLVLVGMILVMGYVSKNIVHPPTNTRKLPLEVAPILIVIGLCAATYMGYVEITQTKAVAKLVRFFCFDFIWNNIFHLSDVFRTICNWSNLCLVSHVCCCNNFIVSVFPRICIRVRGVLK